MADDYLPIACAAHERRRADARRACPGRDPGAIRHPARQVAEPLRVPPYTLDVETRAGAEWLTIRRSGGETEVVRLDHIRSVIEI